MAFTLILCPKLLLFYSYFEVLLFIPKVSENPENYA